MTIFERIHALSHDERAQLLGVIIANAPEVVESAIDTVISWREGQS